jgi:hypothetical protein
VSLLTPELRALVGREVVYRAPEPLSRSAFRYFALALGDDNVRWRSGEAPPTFVVESIQYRDDRDALLRGGDVWGIEIPGTRALRGGHEYEFHRPVRDGDRLVVTWRIADIEEKTTSTGTRMLIVLSEATYRTDDDDELLAVNRETVIYQELA